MEQIFSLGGRLAMTGWFILLLSPLGGRWAGHARLVAGIVIPTVLSILYLVLVARNWSSAPGGFGSIDEVRALFSQDGMLVAGWVHYLAFDLFVGGWIVRDALAAKIPHLAVVPCFPATLMFGPVGLCLYMAIKLAFRTFRKPMLHESAAS